MAGRKAARQRHQEEGDRRDQMQQQQRERQQQREQQQQRQLQREQQTQRRQEQQRQQQQQQEHQQQQLEQKQQPLVWREAVRKRDEEGAAGAGDATWATGADQPAAEVEGRAGSSGRETTIASRCSGRGRHGGCGAGLWGDDVAFTLSREPTAARALAAASEAWRWSRVQ